MSNLLFHLPYEILSQVFALLDPFTDLASLLSTFPDLGEYLLPYLQVIRHMEKVDPTVLNAIIVWDGDDGNLELLKVFLGKLGQVRHQVIVKGCDYSPRFFQCDIFEKDSSLGEVIFRDVKNIGVEDVEGAIITDRYFSCDEIRFDVCEEMNLVLKTRQFPLMKMRCPMLKKLELKLEGQGMKNGFDWLNQFTMLEKLKIISDDVICGFRFLKLIKLKELILVGESLEFGFFGCEFPNLKRLDLSHLKEILIFLDSKFDILEELNLSNTMIVFPVSLEFPSLNKLNIRGYGVEVPQMKLALRKLESLETIELSTFKYLTQENFIIQPYLKEIIFHNDFNDNNLEDELNLLVSLSLPKLTSLTLHLKTMPCYDFSQLSNTSRALTLTIFLDQDPATEKSSSSTQMFKVDFSARAFEKNLY